MRFCGEISYDTNDGGVHSDICFNNADNHNEERNPGALPDADFRQFVHNCLDEWLNKSNGTGGFWIGDPDYFVAWGG